MQKVRVLAIFSDEFVGCKICRPAKLCAVQLTPSIKLPLLRAQFKDEHFARIATAHLQALSRLAFELAGRFHALAGEVRGKLRLDAYQVRAASGSTSRGSHLTDPAAVE